MTNMTATLSQAKKFTAEFKNTVNSPLASDALTALDSMNFPTTREEAWKYTRLGKIATSTYATCDSLIPANVNKLDGLDAYYLVFINGVFDESSSDTISEEGVTVNVLSQLENSPENLGKLTSHEPIFQAINNAFLNNGVFVHVARKKSLSKPVVIINKATEGNFATNFRNVFIAEESAQAHVIQLFDSDEESNGFTNVVTEAWVAPNANFSFDKWQNEGKAHNHIATELVEQEKDATFNINTITTGGLLTRNDLVIRVNGENGLSNLNGLYFGNEKQHIDNHTTVDHRVPHCESNELYKGIVNDQAKAVFNGKVFVRRDAQKTNAFQQNANILMTDDATVNSKPELEIYADDVKCSHGSVTGQFDEQAVFYLRARGIGEQSARNLLVQAFAADVTNKITIDALRKHIEAYMEGQFNNN